MHILATYAALRGAPETTEAQEKKMLRPTPRKPYGERHHEPSVSADGKRITYYGTVNGDASTTCFVAPVTLPALTCLRGGV